jgi:hypothetical protein
MSVFCNIRSDRHSAVHPFSFDKYILVDIHLIVNLLVTCAFFTTVPNPTGISVNCQPQHADCCFDLTLGMTGTLAVHPFSFDKYIIAENDLIVKKKNLKETVDD